MIGVYKNYLIFEDVNTKDYNVWISGSGTYDAPERNVTFVTIPGRDGNLTIDGGSYKNITVSYPAFISKDFPKYMADFRARMKSLGGYHRLEDTYDPDHYRMAAFTGQMKPKTTALNRAAEFTLTFNCKPQRFLKSGEHTFDLHDGDVIHNPTEYEAKPLFRAYGVGSFSIGNITVSILETTDYIDIDSDLQDAYRGLVNRNGKIKLTNFKFPTLPPGDIGVSISGLSRLEITPRFWTI